MKLFNRSVKNKDKLEYEFLSAALEVTETPASPLGSFVVWTIVAILATAFIWSYFSKIDEVAVARGKVIPEGRLKVVQPLEEGMIIGIYADEGERVKEGQLLIELDSTIKMVDIESIKSRIDITYLEVSLFKSLLNGDDDSMIFTSTLPDGLKDSLIASVQSRKLEFETKRQSLLISLMQSENELSIEKLNYEKTEQRLSTLSENKDVYKNVANSDGIEFQNLLKLQEYLVILEEREKSYKDILDYGGVESKNLTKMENTLEILREQEDVFKQLYDAGAISQKEWLDKNNELQLYEKEYQSQKARANQEISSLELNYKNAVDEYSLTLKEYETQKAKVSEEQTTSYLNLKNISDEIEQYRNELIIQSERIALVKNKIEQGKVALDNLDKENARIYLELIVQKGKELSELEAQLTKAEKNANFQKLVAPIDGTIHAIALNTIGGVITPAQTIMTIVPNDTGLLVEALLPNKDIGFVEAGQEVSLKFDTFPFQKYGTIDGSVISISPDAFEDENLGTVYRMKVSIKDNPMDIIPGMTVTAEIKTGKRRIIDFFIAPVKKHTEESLKLR